MHTKSSRRKDVTVPFKSGGHHYESDSFPWVGRVLRENDVTR